MRILAPVPARSGSRAAQVAQPPSEESLSDGHEVLRQRASLVAADVGGAAHGLTRRHVPHKVVVRLHPLHRIGQGNGDGQRQALWNGDHDDGDRIDKKPNLTQGMGLSEVGAELQGRAG
jgi:hypothetical protein